MDNKELAIRLSEQKKTVRYMAYAMKLAFPSSEYTIDNDAQSVCSWIDDACEALRKETPLG